VHQQRAHRQWRREQRHRLILRLAAEGKGIRQITRELGIDRKTVRAWLRVCEKIARSPQKSHSSLPACGIRLA
jgi:transposase-like protein